MREIYDVVIVGGGVAGCTTALSIAKYAGGVLPPVTILVIDDSDSESFKIGESLPPESTRLLHHIHHSLPKRFGEEINAGAHLLCTGNASSWATGSLEERHAILNPFGHGFHLDRAKFDDLLRSCVNDEAGKRSLKLLKGKFSSVEKTKEGFWVVNIVSGGSKTNTLQAKWLVDASGRKASVATKLGARSVITDPLLAFYALFTGTTDQDKDHRTIIEATSQGWFYSSLLSLDTPTRLIAFHTLPTHPAAKIARRKDGFIDLLHSESEYISRIVQDCDYSINTAIQGGGGAWPRCTAAGSSHLDKLGRGSEGIHEKWVAVGDAALAFDPLSSQGMMTALEMGHFVGALLAEELEVEMSTNEDKEKGMEGMEIRKTTLQDEIEGMYKKVREEYQGHRDYYYRIVKRFRGEEFWDNVVAQSHVVP